MTKNWIKKILSSSTAIGTGFLVSIAPSGSFAQITSDELMPTKPQEQTPDLKRRIPAMAGQLDSSPQNEESPVLLSADEVNYDETLNIITARGNVELVQEGRVLLADTLSYNQTDDTITASGDVKLLETTGDVMFAEYMELTDKMTKGTLRQIRFLMSDNARLAANGARRFSETKTELARAVYTPCDVCKETPEKDPLWQLKADKVVHDGDSKTIEYYNSWMEIFGLPVAYFPYFQHPDPSVDRASGILPPSFGNDNNIGTFFRLPYYWAISEDKDFTFDPIYTSKSGLVASGEYRQAFESGDLYLQGSIVNDSEYFENSSSNKGHTRWHIASRGSFDLDETWSWGFDGNKQSDRLYMDQFSFWGDPGNTLDSQINIEGIKGRNYFRAEGLYWQELRSSVSTKQSTIFPNITYAGVGPADKFGGHWTLDGNIRGLKQGAKSESLRNSLKAGYDLFNTTSFGLATVSSLSLQGDLYDTNHLDNTDLSEDIQTRLTPRISTTARMPFYRSVESGSQVIEPIAGIYASPNSGYDRDIRNDDSLVVEQDETSLFQDDMTPGIDRMETGTRTSYGFRMGHYFDDGLAIESTVAQYYRFSEDQTLFEETGIDEGASDYFGALTIKPVDYFNVTYRFRADRENLSLNRNEAQFRLGTDDTYFNARYTDIDQTQDPSSTAIEESYLSASVGIDDYWRTTGYWLYDLLGSDSRYAGLSLIYEDECFIFNTSYVRDFTNDGVDGPSDTVMLKLTFKTLGEINQDISGYVPN
ncbi:LPS-assembly protein LptD [Curvivirga sp.]|uniref:LPS-assembly protein LptD n=1 Tax=Curvivirga sp. TaxID=2856848 RepID=UPI003B595527